MSQLDEFRADKDDFFANHPQSPLKPEQKQGFKGMDYFEDNPELKLEIELEKFPDQEQVVIQTSTGQTQTYTRYGKFKFTVEGEAVELTLYSNENGFFLPFADSLAGEETYPAGRYLEPDPLAADSFLVDFNLAYNPYCAYNEMWSCPLTPSENRLKVPIRAGEKIYKN
ncbi:MAG: DUF1684 domain-containing protein [Anaerolineae bacterium]|nr:DUF1684 domain-containing protein [Anaerolineae bacterium]MDK1081226.1 DUF1684 domain-containing protein [Anaerolineae bacterium]